ncbi:MAG: 1-(5-phosphoribosyl)-5-[(5-phosphoribosylamino)methylideneamino]imidazole-4-carboxamide isomerase [Candidatus Tectomicrobia bacterium]|uniref:1-(5-phosphoribosyl)-5-[(5-phosphoribosylamino)methylideneamino] imidazole-4-carboxamide isomerase n=1 Tax=Tectimicrobiota bacterium TaxID=2528274 RepID=A0A932I1D5_UNCTE|nr:1-(5-phosphoribosyl)-5-[(5-phosphoribosylamino)methylideneamino]imidazole-4-carboxamide isomerase [Candidatus Tectomicrobia bacterium]
MLIIPAVDLRGGKCVRLIQGRKESEIVYGDDPVEMARRWVEMGAKRLHLIDLDGAFEGEPVHLDVLARAARELGVPVQFGGGVRSESSLRAVLEAGARFVILGTSALRDPDFLRQAAQNHPGRILLGIDAKDGEVRISGWEEGEAIGPEALARRFDGLPLAGVIFTDIRRDGTLGGFEPAATVALAQACGRPVFAAGGVSRLEDIEKLLLLSEKGVAGAVVGRAIYEGTLDLRAALEMVPC